MKIALLLIAIIVTIMVIVSPAGNDLTQEQLDARTTFMSDWNRLSMPRGNLGENTLVVYVQNTQNPFVADPDMYAREYHPRTVNGQTCSELGIDYIQVRSITTDSMLSGITCN